MRVRCSPWWAFRWRNQRLRCQRCARRGRHRRGSIVDLTGRYGCMSNLGRRYWWIVRVRRLRPELRDRYFRWRGRRGRCQRCRGRRYSDGRIAVSTYSVRIHLWRRRGGFIRLVWIICGSRRSRSVHRVRDGFIARLGLGGLVGVIRGGGVRAILRNGGLLRSARRRI